MMLYTGFIGGAYWSVPIPPTPLSFAFWLQRLKPYFAGSKVTMYQSHLQDFPYSWVLCWAEYRIRLPVVLPFHPASGVDD
jgi:hypothetical protein